MSARKRDEVAEEPAADAEVASAKVSGSEPRTKGMTMCGFCAFPSPGSHAFCREQEFSCSCPCRVDPEFSDPEFIDEPLPESGDDEEDGDSDAA